jgi:hypothetical protein
MPNDQQLWQDWARILKSWGIDQWVASLLDAFGPLTILGAQCIYISQPILGSFLPDKHLSAFAKILEEPDQAKAFSLFLRSPGI